MSSRQLTGNTPVKRLAQTIDEALELLKEVPTTPDGSSGTPIQKAPASLLDECMTLCSQHEAIAPEPIRTIHHFACTGGTLFSKCLAAMPNSQLLSEVDPLSTLQVDPSGKPRFAPTDMIQQMRQSTRGEGTDLFIELFLSNIEQIYSDSSKKGLRLIIRDHAHSHFCVGANIPGRPTLRDMLSRNFPVVSVLTVRHPLDSYLSLRLHAWEPSPNTLDEYCRRYLAFLDAYPDIPIVKYEHFLFEPQTVMAAVCEHLKLPYSSDFEDLHSVFNLTGDSGRRGKVIRPRPRRSLTPELAAEQQSSQNYRALLARLDCCDEGAFVPARGEIKTYLKEHMNLFL